MVFIEASACGTPVIAGKAGGTASSVKEGINGYRVDGNSVDEIQGRLRNMLGDAEQIRHFGAGARRWVEDNFSWDHVARKTAAICAKQPQ